MNCNVALKIIADPLIKITGESLAAIAIIKTNLHKQSDDWGVFNSLALVSKKTET